MDYKKYNIQYKNSSFQNCNAYKYYIWQKVVNLISELELLVNQWPFITELFLFLSYF